LNNVKGAARDLIGFNQSLHFRGYVIDMVKTEAVFTIFYLP